MLCANANGVFLVWRFFVLSIFLGGVFSLQFRTNILSFTIFAVSKWEKDFFAGGVVEEMCSNCAGEA